jgi:opacity protein-like surface antigen
MKKIIVLAVLALFLLAGAGSALAKPPALEGTNWEGTGSLIVAGQNVQNFDITFNISTQNGALFSGTANTNITGFDPQVPVSFTGYIATNKSMTFTIQSPNELVPNPVAVSAAKWSSKTIAGDIQVFPLAATGYFSVKKQKP